MRLAASSGEVMSTHSAESATLTVPCCAKDFSCCMPAHAHHLWLSVLQVAPGLAYDSLLLPIMDENPYLSDGNKQVTRLPLQCVASSIHCHGYT